MGQTLLVDRKVPEGKALLEALDRAALDVKAALWAYFADSEEWMLIIALPILDQKGAKAAYEAVQSVLVKDRLPFQFALSDIAIVSPHSELIERLRTVFKTAPMDLDVVDLSYLNVYGTYLGDGIIYRI